MILFWRRGKTVSEDTIFKTILFLDSVTLDLRGRSFICPQVRLTYSRDAFRVGISTAPSVRMIGTGIKTALQGSSAINS